LNTIYFSDAYGPAKGTIANYDQFTNSDKYFVPVGRIHAEYDGDTKRYFITGTLTTGTKKDENGNYKFVTNTSGDGLELFDMEVTERAFNYGKRQ